MVIRMENWRTLYKHFQCLIAMRGQCEGWTEFFCATEIRVGADPAGYVTLSLWVIAELFTEIPAALDFVQTNAMCSGITEQSLKGRKEGLLLGMA